MPGPSLLTLWPLSALATGCPGDVSAGQSKGAFQKPPGSGGRRGPRFAPDQEEPVGDPQYPIPHCSTAQTPFTRPPRGTRAAVGERLGELTLQTLLSHLQRAPRRSRPQPALPVPTRDRASRTPPWAVRAGSSPQHQRSQPAPTCLPTAATSSMRTEPLRLSEIPASLMVPAQPALAPDITGGLYPGLCSCGPRAHPE